MTRPSITRREALALLSAVPLTASLAAQDTPTRPARRQIFAGTSHVLLLESDGTLKAWVSQPGAPNPNLRGQLGVGHADVVANHTLFTAPGLKGVVTAAAGLDYSLVALDDGRVLAWGSDGFGTLGITRPQEIGADLMGRPDANTPTPLSVGVDATSVSAGARHALALTRQGTVLAWGDGRFGRLGIGEMPTLPIAGANRTLQEVPYPVSVPGLTDVAAVAAGGEHSVFLMRDGTVRACGRIQVGQLGDGTQKDSPNAVRVPGVTTATAVVAGLRHSAALLADGRVMAWGEQPGLGRPAARSPFDGTPAPAAG